MLADYYSYRYDLPEAWGDLVDVMTNHSEKKISFIQNFVSTCCYYW